MEKETGVTVASPTTEFTPASSLLLNLDNSFGDINKVTTVADVLSPSRLLAAGHNPELAGSDESEKKNSTETEVVKQVEEKAETNKVTENKPEETEPKKDAEVKSEENSETDDKSVKNKIPYDRFQKVNEERKQLREELSALRSELDSLKNTKKDVELSTTEKADLKKTEEGLAEDDVDNEIFEAIKPKINRITKELDTRIQKLETELKSKEKEIVDLRSKDESRDMEIARIEFRKEVDGFIKKTTEKPLNFDNNEYIFNPDKYADQVPAIDKYLEKEPDLEKAFKLAVINGEIKPIKKSKEATIKESLKTEIAAKASKATVKGVDIYAAQATNENFSAFDAGMAAIAQLRKEGKIK